MEVYTMHVSSGNWTPCLLVVPNSASRSFFTAQSVLGGAGEVGFLSQSLAATLLRTLPQISVTVLSTAALCAANASDLPLLLCLPLCYPHNDCNTYCLLSDGKLKLNH